MTMATVIRTGLILFIIAGPDGIKSKSSDGLWKNGDEINLLDRPSMAVNKVESINDGLPLGRLVREVGKMREAIDKEVRIMEMDLEGLREGFKEGKKRSPTPPRGWSLRGDILVRKARVKRDLKDSETKEQASKTVKESLAGERAQLNPTEFISRQLKIAAEYNQGKTFLDPATEKNIHDIHVDTEESGMNSNVTIQDKVENTTPVVETRENTTSSKHQKGTTDVQASTVTEVTDSTVPPWTNVPKETTTNRATEKETTNGTTDKQMTMTTPPPILQPVDDIFFSTKAPVLCNKKITSTVANLTTTDTIPNTDKKSQSETEEDGVKTFFKNAWNWIVSLF